MNNLVEREFTDNNEDMLALAQSFKRDKKRKLKRLKVKPRFYIFLVVCMLIFFGIPYFRVKAIQGSQKREISALQQEIEMVRTRISEKKDKIAYMKTHRFVEEEARKLGMTKKGETRYLLAEPFSPQEAEENRRRNPNELKDNNY